MNRLVLLVIVCSVAAVSAVAHDPGPATAPTTRPDMTPRIAENTVIARDVPFAGPASTDKQRLDIYAPRGARSAPVVVFIHGGEWTKGDKSEVSFKPRYLNEHGVIFVAANYRLSGTDKHPAQVADVATALRWVRGHIAEFGGDPKKIVLMGHSAGCHLVTLATLDPRILGRVDMKPTDLAAVISWSGGAFDLVEKVNSGGKYAGYIHANFGDDPAVWRDASPMNHVGDSRQLPPYLFASAGAGNAASREAAEKMASLINAAGGHADTLLLKGKSHTNANHEVGMPGDETGPELLKYVQSVTSNR